MSMYITFTWQRPAVSSRADGCVRALAGPNARDLGLGADDDKRQPGGGSQFLSWAGDGPRLGASAKLKVRACRAAGTRGKSAKARRPCGGRPTRFPPALLRKPAPARAASALLPGARAKVGPRSSRGRIREGQPSRSALARARRLTAAQRWRAAVIPPAPADNEPKQAQPSGWRVDDIVVTCSDPAQWCRAAPAAALGEPVSPSGRGGFHGRARSARPDR
jgi:hypothetical protein